MKYLYFIKVEYINPRTQETYFKRIGPVFTRKVMHDLCHTLLKKRNVISFETTFEKEV